MRALQRFPWVLAVLLLSFAAPALSVQPDEMLADPALEARARDISKELRCLVCRNESIDDSNAPLARDLRLLVRERLVAGDTDAEARQFLVDRYGQYVLLKPPLSIGNAWLYAFPGFALLAGLVAVALYFRRQRTAASQPLTGEERAALDRALRER